MLRGRGAVSGRLIKLIQQERVKANERTGGAGVPPSRGDTPWTGSQSITGHTPATHT